ncbi:MerR family transcriptional regulator [Corynebacterium sp. TAE3-ERU12]|uniref:MerR family transcriptional regulator n=1 Tax=Corynebacterium sp. TAE3-ERU12 TaxID=2849491 RepID=UPI001C497596|nr:MerR family transcriptional regulator [Corynebacterium sp. TAE3-ERU12]MBV7295005.1 MerR family transcriptional regulator [Corynebacterium sp. TAE3-ERU12]
MSNDEQLRTVGEVARLLGLSVRTLHYWEERGLVVPTARTWSEYRLYSDADIERLEQVMVYRATGMSLDHIAEVLTDESDRVVHLRRQKALLMDKKTELDTMIQALDRILEDSMGEKSLSVDEIAEVLGETQFPAYQAEAEQKWGDTEDWHQSQQQQAQMSPADWQKFSEQNLELEQRLAAEMKAGVPADSEQAQSFAEEHRALISRFFPVSHAKQVLIAEGYVQDPRFRKHYDKQAEGLAVWLKQAIDANAAAHGIDPSDAEWA